MGFGQVVHLILDLITLALIGSELLLVDRYHTLLLAGIISHLVELRTQLSNLSV